MKPQYTLEGATKFLGQAIENETMPAEVCRVFVWYLHHMTEASVEMQAELEIYRTACEERKSKYQGEATYAMMMASERMLSATIMQTNGGNPCEAMRDAQEIMRPAWTLGGCSWTGWKRRKWTQMPSSTKCIFCDFTGNLAELRNHSATCSEHPIIRRANDAVALCKLACKAVRAFTENKSSMEKLAGEIVSVEILLAAIQPIRRRE